MVAWSFFLSVSLNNMNLLSSKAVCLFKDKKMRVLTNLLVAHLCCEANSFLACATSVKPTAYYPIITKFIIFITKISKNVRRAGLDFLIFSGLRYKLPRHFLSPVFYSFFSPGRNGFGAHNGKELRVWLTTRWCASSARMAKMTSRIVEPSYEREKRQK